MSQISSRAICYCFTTRYFSVSDRTRILHPSGSKWCEIFFTCAVAPYRASEISAQRERRRVDASFFHPQRCFFPNPSLRFSIFAVVSSNVELKFFFRELILAPPAYIPTVSGDFVARQNFSRRPRFGFVPPFYETFKNKRIDRIYRSHLSFILHFITVIEFFIIFYYIFYYILYYIFYYNFYNNFCNNFLLYDTVIEISQYTFGKFTNFIIKGSN